MHSSLPLSRTMGLLATSFLLYLGPAAAAPFSAVYSPSLPLPVTTLTTFGPSSWAENIAVRSNGQLLITRLDTPILQQVDPLNRTSPITIHTFDTTTYLGLLGITEVSPDVFYVAVQAPYTSNFTTTSPNAIFRIDMSTFSTRNDTIETSATVTHVLDLPESVILNGATTLDSRHILVADSYHGSVYNIDLSTHTYTTPLTLPSMKSPSALIPVGVNGLKIHGSYLYFTNMQASTLSRILIAPSTALPLNDSDAELVVNVPSPDDFVIRSDKTIFIAGDAQNTLYMLREGQKDVVAVAGGNTNVVLAGVSAGAWGKGSGRKGRLFLTTTGAQSSPINGTITVPAAVAYIDTDCI